MLHWYLQYENQEIDKYDCNSHLGNPFWDFLSRRIAFFIVTPGVFTLASGFYNTMQYNVRFIAW